MSKVEANSRKIVARLQAEGWTNVGGGSHDRFVKRQTSRRHDHCASASGAVTRDCALHRKSRGMDMRQEMTHFVGVIDGGGKNWGVRFPDVDGCVGAGETVEEAITSATEALREVMSYKRNGGFEVIKPRTLAEILASGDVGLGESTVMIPLLLDAGRVVRANLTFDAGLLEAIDEAAKTRGLTRSAFLASAAREKIQAQR